MKILTFSILMSIQLVLIKGLPSLRSFSNKCWITDSPCLTAQVQSFIAEVTEGDPGLGTERLDTMIVDSLKIETEDIHFLMKNLRITGLKNAVIDNVSIDNDAKLVRAVFRTDILTTCHYTAKGILFSLPFSGEGDMRMKLENAEIGIHMTFSIIKDIHDRDIMELNNFHYTYDVKDGAQFQLDNLYFGDKQASDKFHELMDQNWKFLTVAFGGPFWDVVTSKIYDTIRSYIHSRPIRNFIIL